MTGPVMDMFHPKFVQILSCPHCSYVTKFIGQFLTHVCRVHASDVSEFIVSLIQCSLCDQICTTKSFLSEHYEIEHSTKMEADDTRLLCTINVNSGDKHTKLSATSAAAPSSEQIDQNIPPEFLNSTSTPASVGEDTWSSIQLCSPASEPSTVPSCSPKETSKKSGGIVSITRPQDNHERHSATDAVKIIPSVLVGVKEELIHVDDSDNEEDLHQSKGSLSIQTDETFSVINFGNSSLDQHQRMQTPYQRHQMLPKRPVSRLKQQQHARIAPFQSTPSPVTTHLTNQIHELLPAKPLTSIANPHVLPTCVNSKITATLSGGTPANSQVSTIVAQHQNTPAKYPIGSLASGTTTKRPIRPKGRPIAPRPPSLTPSNLK